MKLFGVFWHDPGLCNVWDRKGYPWLSWCIGFASFIQKLVHEQIKNDISAKQIEMF